MKGLVFFYSLIGVFVLGLVVHATYSFRDAGAETQFMVIVMLGVIFVAFWFWAKHATVDVLKAKRKKRWWE